MGYLGPMATTDRNSDDTWFARQPWSLPVLLTGAALIIAFSLYLGNLWSTATTTLSFAALICHVLWQRTGARWYRWGTVLGLALVVLTMLVRAGLKQGWW